MPAATSNKVLPSIIGIPVQRDTSEVVEFTDCCEIAATIFSRASKLQIGSTSTSSHVLFESASLVQVSVIRLRGARATTRSDYKSSISN